MRKALAALAAAAVGLAAGTARADLTGQTAPDVAFNASWNGSGEKSLRDFRGRVVFLEIFATW
jgi:ABC-type glycerol-3-phosphate transport system substrate-binding protein